MAKIKYCSISAAAKHCHVPYVTLWQAVDDGSIKRHEMADGSPCVVLADVERWAPTRRTKRGRPKQETKLACDLIEKHKRNARG